MDTELSHDYRKRSRKKLFFISEKNFRAGAGQNYKI